MQRIILDVDTGIDDALAISVAALSPQIDLLACTTVWGNVDVDQAARNTAVVLDLAGRPDVPVALGSRGPYNGGTAWYSPHVHGVDGFGGMAQVDDSVELASESAVECILRLSHEVQGLEIVAVGPLTNLAHALDADPTLPERIAAVTIMGGAAFVPGNVNAFAEANIVHDPEAAARVFAAGWSLSMVGLDVTMRSILTEAHRSRLATGGRLGRCMADILDFYYGFYEPLLGYRAAGNHDALALAVACGLVDVRRAVTVEVGVDCSTGPERGRTIVPRDSSSGAGASPTFAHSARHRVVLETAPGFEDDMVTLIAAAP